MARLRWEAHGQGSAGRPPLRGAPVHDPAEARLRRAHRVGRPAVRRLRAVEEPHGAADDALRRSGELGSDVRSGKTLRRRRHRRRRTRAERRGDARDTEERQRLPEAASEGTRPRRLPARARRLSGRPLQRRPLRGLPAPERPRARAHALRHPDRPRRRLARQHRLRRRLRRPRRRPPRRRLLLGRRRRLQQRAARQTSAVVHRLLQGPRPGLRLLAGPRRRHPLLHPHLRRTLPGRLPPRTHLF
mmetsp:Transcript_3936/g.12203  ORF Transcript_3936/g.12203 Transcript_3936/m.12203 type:complete len:245 (+) Transcript_3936:1330-2064(+)